MRSRDFETRRYEPSHRGRSRIVLEAHYLARVLVAALSLTAAVRDPESFASRSYLPGGASLRSSALLSRKKLSKKPKKKLENNAIDKAGPL